MACRPERPASSHLLLSSSVSSSSPVRKRRRLSTFLSLTYDDCGDCSLICQFCGALFWYAERVLATSTVNQPCYNHCCKSGAVILPFPVTPPHVLTSLYNVPTFRQNIRAYNSMFAMTSFGGQADENINKGLGPYVFKVSGQVCHWLGSLCP